MRDYLNLIRDILYNGDDEREMGYPVRTGVFTKSVFGRTYRHDMSKGFPIQTTKKIWWKGVVQEFIWVFARGDTNIRYLLQNGVKYWTEWPYASYKKLNPDSALTQKGFELAIIAEPDFAEQWGRVGPVYGHMMRKHNDDQYAQVLKSMQENPLGRRHLVIGYDTRLAKMSLLPPCHGNLIQFDIRNGRLNLIMHQRSCDTILGLPFDLCLYGILLEVTARLLRVSGQDIEAGELIVNLGNTHIYENHIDAAKELLDRPPQSLPDFTFLGESLEDLHDASSYMLNNYRHCGKLKSKTEVAV